MQESFKWIGVLPFNLLLIDQVYFEHTYQSELNIRCIFGTYEQLNKC